MLTLDYSCIFPWCGTWWCRSTSENQCNRCPQHYGQVSTGNNGEYLTVLLVVLEWSTGCGLASTSGTVYQQKVQEFSSCSFPQGLPMMSQLVFSVHWNLEEIGPNTSELINLLARWRTRRQRAWVSFFYVLCVCVCVYLMLVFSKTFWYDCEAKDDLKLLSSCLHFLSAGIIDMCHQAQFMQYW